MTDPSIATIPSSDGNTEATHGDAAGALCTALLDSRQRLRDFVGMAGDVAFETDAAGRFVYLNPDPALGWQSATLLGQPAELLLVPGGTSNPFRPQKPMRGRRVWLRRADGGTACLRFAAAPLLDPAGNVVGARGIGADITEDESHNSEQAAMLRRCEVLDHILWRMRQEVLAPRMMTAVLEALGAALGAEGVAIIDAMLDAGATAGAQAVLHQSGGDATGLLDAAFALLRAGSVSPTGIAATDGRSLVACPIHTRFGGRVGLVLWRSAGSRALDAEDREIVGAASGIVRVVLEHESIQLEMTQQARTDPLTGLLNRRAFLEEMHRRIERLEREELPGTLMFADLDNFKELNDRLGHEAGDEALCAVTELLRSVVRPSDLIARLGGDEFALWLDSADELVAAERAETLRVRAMRELSHLSDHREADLSLSIGIATRWPHTDEADVEALLRRADRVMYHVKRSGRGNWRVARPEDE